MKPLTPDEMRILREELTHFIDSTGGYPPLTQISKDDLVRRVQQRLRQLEKQQQQENLQCPDETS